MGLFEGDSNASLLGAIDGVAQAIAALVQNVESLDVDKGY
jgi:hypothetical protein